MLELGLSLSASVLQPRGNGHGTELITNSDFSDGLAGWTVAGNVTENAGEVTFIGDVTQNYVAQQLTGLTVGNSLRLEVLADASESDDFGFVWGPTAGSNAYGSENTEWRIDDPVRFIDITHSTMWVSFGNGGVQGDPRAIGFSAREYPSPLAS